MSGASCLEDRADGNASTAASRRSAPCFAILMSAFDGIELPASDRPGSLISLIYKNNACQC